MPPPAKKSRLGLWIGLGCGCLLIIGAGIVIAILLTSGAISAFGPGEEVATVDVVPGQPFTLPYTQSGDTQHEVWMEVDLNHSQGLSLTGPINIAAPGRPPGQYNLQLTGSGPPIRERSSSKRVNWVHSGGSTSGKTLLFPLPAYDDGATVTLTGTVVAGPGVTANRLRIFVTD